MSHMSSLSRNRRFNEEKACKVIFNKMIPTYRFYRNYRIYTAYRICRTFLVACYATTSRFVGPFIRPSIHPSIRPFFRRYVHPSHFTFWAAAPKEPMTFAFTQDKFLLLPLILLCPSTPFKAHVQTSRQTSAFISNPSHVAQIPAMRLQSKP